MRRYWVKGLAHGKVRAGKDADYRLHTDSAVALPFVAGRSNTIGWNGME